MNASEVLPTQFNVAEHFVDRNVAEGRGASAAFRYADRTLTYADVQDLVNRAGNALLDLGVGLEDRVLPKFVRRYASLKADAVDAIAAFAADVRAGRFPDADESYHLSDEVRRSLGQGGPQGAEPRTA